MRLDQYLNKKYKKYTRSLLQKWIKNGNIKCNGITQTKNSYIIKESDEISIEIPEVKESKILAQNIPLNIIFENDDFIIINKPAGLVVHPGAGQMDGTLVNALLNYCPLSSIGGVYRPGIVHRLDKDTSGLMVVAKNDKTHNELSNQFSTEKKTLMREYVGWVRLKSCIPPQGTIHTLIARHPTYRQKMSVQMRGKESITHYTFDTQITDHIWRVKFRLETGRTHQIRVHTAYKGMPILGDALYGKSDSIFKRQALHAFHLSFLYKHQQLNFHCPLPNDLLKFEKKILDLLPKNF